MTKEHRFCTLTNLSSMIDEVLLRLSLCKPLGPTRVHLVVKGGGGAGADFHRFRGVDGSPTVLPQASPTFG